MIVNAAHAIAEVVGDGGESKGMITVSTRRKDGRAEIRIADTGTGMSEEIKDKIFDPFFTTKGVGKGTGLGLSICYGIIDKMGGTISVNSAVGVGTTFHIRFPASGSGPQAQKP